MILDEGHVCMLSLDLLSWSYNSASFFISELYVKETELLLGLGIETHIGYKKPSNLFDFIDFETVYLSN